MTRTRLPNLDDVRTRLNDIATQLDGTFVQRGPHIMALMVTTLAGEHLLYVGDPGTGKTALAKTFARHITDAAYWKRTFGTFTPPEKIVGPMDIKQFQAGRYVHQTNGALPTADLAMCDELFKGSQVVNEMLDILGPEREFDHTPIPLISACAASNWPEILRKDAIVDALYDRFLTRVVVERVEGRDGKIAVMKAARAVKDYTPQATVSVSELRAAVADVTTVDVSDAIYGALADLMERVEPTDTRQGIAVSERRAGQLVKLLQASAWLDDRTSVTMQDFGVLEWGMWEDRDDIEIIRAALTKLDDVAVKEVIDALDVGRQAYADCKAGGFGAARLNAAMATCRKVGAKVKALVAQPVFTQIGKEKIARAQSLMKVEFEELRAEAAELKKGA